MEGGIAKEGEDGRMADRDLSLSFFVDSIFNWEEKGVLWAEGRVKNCKLGELSGGSKELCEKG